MDETDSQKDLAALGWSLGRAHRQRLGVADLPLTIFADFGGR